MQLKPQQQPAFDKIAAFLGDSRSQIFILKGYAGTGKTSMITLLLEHIAGIGKKTMLLAPTGRAAKVLRDKTGHDTRTIHSAIYSKAKLKVKRYDVEGKLIKAKGENAVDDSGVDKIEYTFGLKTVADCSNIDGDKFLPDRTVIIVDEASLISSRPAEGELFHFGTDVLLDDLLTFAQIHSGSKIIFVGDPAQLPPVGDTRSVALCEDYFEEKGLRVDWAELTEVLRQEGEGAILKNAMLLRRLLDSPMRNSLTFDYRSGEFEAISPAEVVGRFVQAQPRPEIGENIVICFSNAKVKAYNDAIRRHYFPDSSGIQPGDVLQIVKNDYNHRPVGSNERVENADINLYNGDFVRVTKVLGPPEQQRVRSWVSRGGRRAMIDTILTFRDVEIATADGRHFIVKILETLLENDKASLSSEQHIALYRLFREMNEDVADDGEALALAQRSDPYLNALHVKYGYAITAHKSQGGEWAAAFVDYTGRTGLSDDHLRWAYTATTRVSKRLYAVNAPNITPFSKFSINEIRPASKVPKGAMSLAEADASDDVPFMNNFRRWKYNCTKSRLGEIGCSISAVEPMQYFDRYHILTPAGMETIDCWYNDAEMFGKYNPITSATEYTPLILNILNDESAYRYDVKYTPSFASLEALRQKVVSACDELDIPITNIQEFRDNYYVLYSLKTSGRYSSIQFYFKGSGDITSAKPSSDLGAQDQLLTNLIEKLAK